MKELDGNLKSIEESKNPVLAVIEIARVFGEDYLYSLLNRAIEIANIKLVENIYRGMRVIYIHEVNLFEMSNISKSL